MGQTLRILPGSHHADVVSACIGQLQQVMVASVSVVGLYKARFRDPTTSAFQLHKDDVLITEDDVRLALFPALPAGNSIAENVHFFDRYVSFCSDLKEAHPQLILPSAPDFFAECIGQRRYYWT